MLLRLFFLLLLALFFHPHYSRAAPPSEALKVIGCEEILSLITLVLGSDAAGEDLNTALHSALLLATEANILKGYCRLLKKNLMSKARSQEEGVIFTESELIRRAIQFESFRIQTYISSGVLPKRYFGFFDEVGETSPYERILRETATAVAALLNNYAEEKGMALRVTPMEIVITYLSEGGALLLTDEIDIVNRAHPVRHVGLDDYRKGFATYPTLIESIDRTFGTYLGRLNVNVFGHSLLIRPLTFTEAILATGVMYLYEKDLAEQMRIADGRISLAKLPLNEQFIHTSLVYNSGILFSEDRVKMILSFQTAAYLVDVNLKNSGSRPALPIKSKAESIAHLSMGGDPPRQLTSWNAVYHILQRYGAWVGIQQYSDFFTDAGYYRSETTNSVTAKAGLE